MKRKLVLIIGVFTDRIGGILQNPPIKTRDLQVNYPENSKPIKFRERQNKKLIKKGKQCKKVDFFFASAAGQKRSEIINDVPKIMTHPDHRI